jgi:hypothetical protein
MITFLLYGSQIKETYTFRETVGASPRSKAITDVIFERTGIIIYQMKQDYPQRQKELYRDENYIKRNLKVRTILLHERIEDPD